MCVRLCTCGKEEEDEEEEEGERTNTKTALVTETKHTQGMEETVVVFVRDRRCCGCGRSFRFDLATRSSTKRHQLHTVGQ